MTKQLKKTTAPGQTATREERPSLESKQVRMLQDLCRIFRLPEKSFAEMSEYIVNECLRISGSKLGIFGLVSADETSITASAWSAKAGKNCTVPGQVAGPLHRSGIWAEPIRRHKPVIVNDYQKPDPRKKGYPEGHVPISRFMSIPIIEGGRAVSVVTVANSKRDYGAYDYFRTNLFLECVWGVIKRKQSEEALQQAYGEMENRIKERTADLRRANKSLEQEILERKQAEKQVLASNELLRSLTSELARTEERERRRIAADLHDHIGQTLALTKMKLDALLDQTDAAGLAKPLLDIRELINQSIQQTRSLMTDLSPSVLYELGFAEAIEWLCEHMQAQHGLTVDLKNYLKIPLLDEEMQLFLFRAIREALLNVVKHAGVKEAAVVLRKKGKFVLVTVRDKGRGMDLSTLDRGRRQMGGFGLLSIRERLKYLGGHFEMESEKGQGTTLTLLAPWQRRKEGAEGQRHKGPDTERNNESKELRLKERTGEALS